MMLPRVLLLCAALAALTPMLARAPRAATSAPPAWPAQFEGRPLRRLEMTADERRMLAGFPGDVARFTDGERDIVLRWVTQPTRQLHPAEDCYRGFGFTTAAARIEADRDGVRWRCFTASKDGATREICEQLRDADGAHWTDVSAWYWDATLERTHGPWLVTTVTR